MTQKTVERKMTFKDKMKGVGKEFLNNLKMFVITASITAAVVLPLTHFVWQPAFVPSESMEPTLMTGDFVVYSRRAYDFAEPARGDIILFIRENDENYHITKRIVGVPGDTIEIINGKTYVNDEYYDEGDWLAEAPDEEISMDRFEVPEGCYFCMGDNRNNSFDCRYWPEHFVKAENIEGKCVFAISINPELDFKTF